MGVRFDTRKSDRNANERGISFDGAREFDWSTARIAEDVRVDYGEQRYIAIGYINLRLHVPVSTSRGADVHVISLRKANRREIRRCEENQTRSSD